MTIKLSQGKKTVNSNNNYHKLQHLEISTENNLNTNNCQELVFLF